MEYGVRRDFGRPFQINGKIGDKTRTDFMQVLTYVFTLHNDFQKGNKSVPEASIDFTKNLRDAIKEMLSEASI